MSKFIYILDILNLKNITFDLTFQSKRLSFSNQRVTTKKTSHHNLINSFQHFKVRNRSRLNCDKIQLNQFVDQKCHFTFILLDILGFFKLN